MLTSRSGRRSSGDLAGTAVPSVQAVGLGAEPLFRGEAKQGMCQLTQLVPAPGGMDVDLDHPWVGRDQQVVYPRVWRWTVAFQDQLHLVCRGDSADQANQLD